MNHRELGATGLSVSAVGMGCNRLGETVATEAEWVELVRRAADLEVNLFDTSARYTKPSPIGMMSTSPRSTAPAKLQQDVTGQVP
jgi:aryl-alcohol dehydrogenase-like predicted oxidoreductase